MVTIDAAAMSHSSLGLQWVAQYNWQVKREHETEMGEMMRREGVSAKCSVHLTEWMRRKKRTQFVQQFYLRVNQSNLSIFRIKIVPSRVKVQIQETE